LSAISEVVARALAEDLTPLGDITSALLPPGARAEARLVPRADGVLAGREAATEAFRQVDPSIAVEWSAADGDRIGKGDTVATVDGPLASVLTAERTALNLLCHLSGIATLTRRFVDAVAAAGGTARVWDTRKTTPGLRSLEKAAVRAGGGVNHRGNLSDWVMFKDNHLAVLPIAEAVRSAKERWPGRTVHVECDSLDQVREAVEAGATAVLLDNMSPDDVRAAVGVVGGRCLIEVSGGVTLATVADYAVPGVDCISSGALTSSAPVLDLGLDVVVRAPG
jgi:nicotinate-nucleotide pyrophosphorylase (carboxylating)